MPKERKRSDGWRGANIREETALQVERIIAKAKTEPHSINAFVEQAVQEKLAEEGED